MPTVNRDTYSNNHTLNSRVKFVDSDNLQVSTVQASRESRTYEILSEIQSRQEKVLTSLHKLQPATNGYSKIIAEMPLPICLL